MNDLLQLNKAIKKEAEVLLSEKGLWEILIAYGAPQISGSYTLDLMTWRDLDIYLEAEFISEAAFFEMGGKLCEALHPVKMSFRNERIAKSKGLPCGLYWGIYLGNERAGAWKIDIWAVDATECARLMAYANAIKQELTPEAVSRILEIKAQCWTDPGYRRSFNSMDIYEAVLQHQVRDMAGFKTYLADRVTF